ncbi:hypothetical protein MTR_3g075130 [Medicago truncatula]|uniref:Uncharacterized protein n=1 Tax=Medicago truncatula TaxID=3880 RepID=A0A072UZK5_MEDTR|nr:hypothetical protein MTR_3g075130 [Medicago truncatula]
MFCILIFVVFRTPDRGSMKCPISQMIKVTLEPLDSPEVIISVIISGVKKKMPMEMTPNLFICNEKLNATGPPEIIIKKEYNEDETVTCVVLADNSHLV